MYPDLYKGLGLKPEDLTVYNFPLVSFEGRLVTPMGLIRLPVQIGMDVVEVDFIVVDVFSPYTAIVGRPWLHTLKAVSSTLHQKVKYSSGDQVLEIVGSQAAARQCQVAAIQHRLEVPSNGVECEELEKAVIADDPEKFFRVGANLPSQEKANLLEFLRANVDVFAWDPYEAPGVDPNFICHRLNVNPSVVPKRQPPRRPSKEHAEAVRSEVAKLKQAGAIEEIFYPQ
ncbi:uncharacterized protein LOC115990681 [Quercus lobata]|uniref:uncharacterized protein LOC115990681 n=1 Tax=Quercus lobata TaxID=97700 RepID=UPI001248C745|nr:uncharacterized protein LOC115990681 [Quercus lobata]